MIEYEYEYEEEYPAAQVSQREEEIAAQMPHEEEALLNELSREEIGIQTNIQCEYPWHELFANQSILDNKILELYGCENRLGWVQTMLIIILFCMAIFFYGRYTHVW